MGLKFLMSLWVRFLSCILQARNHWFELITLNLSQKNFRNLFQVPTNLTDSQRNSLKLSSIILIGIEIIFCRRFLHRLMKTLKIYHQLRFTQQKVFEQLYLINEYWFFSFKRILNCLPCLHYGLAGSRRRDWKTKKIPKSASRMLKIS